MRALLLGLLLCLPIHGDEFCRALSYGIDHQGPLFSAHLGIQERTNPDGTYFRLGTGLAGGTVYRVFPPSLSEAPYIRKEYRSAVVRDRDLAALNTLRTAHMNRPEFPTGFALVEAVVEGAQSLRLPDVAGRDLHSLLIDPRIPQEFKNRLRNHFHESLRTFSNFLHRTLRAVSSLHDSERDMFRDKKFDDTSILMGNLENPTTQRPETLLIKSDNVIVHYDSTPGSIRMTLVDPY